MILKEKLSEVLRWGQKYTKTNMVYVAKGGFWIILGRSILALISLATLTAFANLISQETYGTYQFVLSIAGILAIFSLNGIDTSLIRSVAKNKEGSLKTAFKIKFSWSLLGSLALLGISGWYFLNGNALLAGAFLIASIFFPLRMVPIIFESFWQGRKRFDTEALLVIFTDLAIALSVITTLFLTDNLWFIVLAFFGSTSFFYSLAYLYTKKKIKNNEVDIDLVPFGKNLTLMTAIQTIAVYLDRVILWKLLGPVHVAIYSFAILPIQKVRGFNIVKKLALPKLSENGVEGSERKKSVFRKFLLLFLGTVPLAGALALVAPYVYQFLFPQYMESVIYFQVLCIWIALMPFTLLDASLIAEMKTKFLYTEKLVAPLVKIALFLALAPIYGIWGIVFAIIFAEILRGGMLLYFFYRM